MKTFKFLIINAFIFALICNSCKTDKRFYIINNSDIAIYWGMSNSYDPRNPANIDWYEKIKPHTKMNFAPPYRLDITWESYFYKCYGDTVCLWLYNADEIIDYHKDSQLQANTLIRYDITLQDLINLNWEITYPPPPAMKDIKMYPPYNEVKNNE